MIKGGYKIIDFKGTALSETSVTKLDVLTALNENYGKAVLLTGILIGDNRMDDCFSTPLPDGDNGFILNAYDGFISVTKTGSITYTVASGADVITLKNKLLLAPAYNLTGIQNAIFSLSNKDSMFFSVGVSVTNAIFGISTASLGYAVKYDDNTVRVTFFDMGNGKIGQAKCVKSDNTYTWTDKYIFTGEAVTP
jgi:hypothetical protein